MSTDDINVTRNDALRRYEISVDGELAGFADIQPSGEVTVFPHTEIAERFGGRGLGTRLVKAALDDMQARGQRVVAQCSLVAAVIAKNPEYQQLLA
jgi:predicted GNAT family acetyltransferase